MNVKKSLGSRIIRLLPKEPNTLKMSANLDFQPLQLKTRVNKKGLFLGLIGGIFAVLFGIGYVFLGLIFSGILRNFGIYATTGSNIISQQWVSHFVINNYIFGGIGLTAGILGIVGSTIEGKPHGGILMVIASILSLITLGYLGALPFILLLIGGILTLRQKPLTTATRAEK